ncbi:MAG: hypothetical protein SF172_13940 [Burkholderiales bacterium]|nr:hypothetical protein [Burkholderiales bacterium]
MGKDINADLLGYHVYSAHALWTGQYESDFMGTGTQGYLNPVGLLPFYLMLKAGWHSIVIGMLLATVHALNLVFLARLCYRHLFAGASNRLLYTGIAVTLAAVSPVFIAVIGGTFLDATLSVLILGGVALIANALALEKTRGYRFAVAGLLMGLATGLKLTNILYVAATVAALFPLLIRSRSLVPMATYVVAASLGAVATGGYWAVQMYLEFGNPVFPLLNQVFASPDFPPFNLDHDRFKAYGLKDLLILPLRMMQLNSGVYVEIVAPDIRVALLVVLTAAALARLVYEARTGSPSLTLPALTGPVPFIAAFYTFALVAWAMASGNGRYAIPLLLLTGPLLVVVVQQVWRSEKWRVGTLLVVLCMQIGHAAKAGYPRWDAGPWTRNWIDVIAHRDLLDTPYAYLNLNTSNTAYIAPFVAPGSSFMSLVGLDPIDPEGPGGSRAREFIERNRYRLRMLAVFDGSQGNVEDDQALIRYSDSQLSPWGMRVNPGKCTHITVSMAGRDLTPEQLAALRGSRALPRLVFSCELEHGNNSDASTEFERPRIRMAMDNVQRACPLLFPAPGGYPTKVGAVWFRRHNGTDTLLGVMDGRVQYSRYPYGPFAVDLGPVELWESGTSISLKCQRNAKPW